MFFSHLRLSFTFDFFGPSVHSGLELRAIISQPFLSFAQDQIKCSSDSPLVQHGYICYILTVHRRSDCSLLFMVCYFSDDAVIGFIATCFHSISFGFTTITSSMMVLLLPFSPVVQNALFANRYFDANSQCFIISGFVT